MLHHKINYRTNNNIQESVRSGCVSTRIQIRYGSSWDGFQFTHGIRKHLDWPHGQILQTITLQKAQQGYTEKPKIKKGQNPSGCRTEKTQIGYNELHWGLLRGWIYKVNNEHSHCFHVYIYVVNPLSVRIERINPNVQVVCFWVHSCLYISCRAYLTRCILVPSVNTSISLITVVSTCFKGN